MSNTSSSSPGHVRPGSAAERVGARLRQAIAAGLPGDPLPSVRALVAELHVSAATVSQAIAQLHREGLVVAQPGHGTFIAERAVPALPRDHGWQSLVLGEGLPTDALQALIAETPPGALPLGSGYTDSSLQPVAMLARITAQALRRPDAWERTPCAGIEPLRAWFAHEAGGSLRASDVIIVQGAQAAISTAVRAIARPGASILVESPTYVGVIAVARALGLRPVPVPCDEGGIRPDLLRAAFAASGARVLYCQPCYTNPTGTCLPAERQAAVLAAAREAGAFIIEDDYARDLTLHGRPPPSLVSTDDDHVIYIRSMTKSIAPSLRVAALCARGPVLARLRASRIIDDFFVPAVLQEVTLAFVTSAIWPRHLKELQRALRERQAVAVAALARHVPSARLALVPQGGFSLWVELPPEVDEMALVRRAALDGVSVSPGRHWFPAEPEGSFMRLSIAAAPPGDIEEGIARLGAIVGSL
jgi:DNA-binding transcriptional MocR family regulator